MTTQTLSRLWNLVVFLVGGGIAVACPLAMSYAISHDGDKSERPKGFMALTPGKHAVDTRVFTGKSSDRFPNIVLRTQDDKPVRFYDDLVKDKTVLINFIYTSCQKSCIPTTANLARVHKILGDRVGRDLLFLSISLDPTVDTPKSLKEYASRFGQYRGWYFLTGNEGEIDALRRSLGAYDLDPAVDADKTQHAGIVVFGNDATNRWGSLPTLMDYRHIAQTVLRIARRPA